jgi:hypothetical protein
MWPNDASYGAQGKPETSNFLGFTHCCGTTGKVAFTIKERVRRQGGIHHIEAQSGECRPSLVNALDQSMRIDQDPRSMYSLKSRSGASKSGAM